MTRDRRSGALKDYSCSEENSEVTKKITASIATMTDQAVPTLVIAKPSLSETTVFGSIHSSISDSHCDQSFMALDSKCDFVNICQKPLKDSNKLHDLPTPRQSCTCAAITKQDCSALREYYDILEKEHRRGTDGHRAIQKLRQLKEKRSMNDLFFDANGIHIWYTFEFYQPSKLLSHTPLATTPSVENGSHVQVLVCFSCLLFFALLVALTYIHLDALVNLLPVVVNQFMATRLNSLAEVEVPPPPPKLTVTEKYWIDILEFADKMRRVIGHFAHSVLGLSMGN